MDQCVASLTYQILTLVANALQDGNKLNFHAADLSNVGADNLFSLLSASGWIVNVKVLNFSRMPRLTIIGYNSLADFLRKSKHLEELDLTESQIPPQSRPVLTDAIAANSTLQKFHLTKSKLGNAGGYDMAHAIHHNHGLLEIDLSENDLGQGDGAAILAIGSALEVNECLQLIDLSRNIDGRTGDGVKLAEVIAKALTFNTHLTHLIIENNYMDKAGALALANALRRNSTIEHMSCSSNSFGPSGVKAISAALKTCYMTEVDLVPP